MNFPPELLALLVILIFASLLFLAIRTSRKQAAEKTHQALTMGFDIPDVLPTQFASRIESIYQRKDGQAVYIDNIFYRSDHDHELFIFDVSHGGDSEMGSDVFGMISNELALPRFSLVTLPGFNKDSFIGDMMDRLLDKVLENLSDFQDLERIDLSDRTDYGSQVIVLGKDPAAVKELLAGISIETLTDNASPLHIAGKDDFLVVDFSIPTSPTATEHDLIAQFEYFNQISRAFLK
jgi:hypothetical protein